MQFLVHTRYLHIPTAQPWQRVRVRRLSDHVADCATNSLLFLHVHSMSRPPKHFRLFEKAPLDR